MNHIRSVVAGACLIAASPLMAANRNDEARIARLEQQIEMQQKQIARLELLLARQAEQGPQPTLTPIQQAASADQPAPALASSQQIALETPPKQLASATPSPIAPASEKARVTGFNVSGDIRLREEFNFSERSAPDRARTVLRARLRASYAISDHFTVGAQLATGDPDDPNSTDITLGGFDDDLDIALDQAWVRYTSGGLTLYGGKFPQIFAGTDMVWDGDVVPEGVGGIYAFDLGRGAKLDVRAMYFILDEAPAGPDSYMVGGQTVLAVPLAKDWKASLAGSFYGYHLRSLTGGDSGDFRTNLFANGRYLSGFQLVGGMGTLAYSGLGAHWPVSLTVDYIHNLSASVSADTGINTELAAGRRSDRGDWRLSYNYARVGVDAVFAAFSQDNIAFGSNYILHGTTLSHVARKNLIFDFNVYRYRLLDRSYAHLTGGMDWLYRTRANLSLMF